MEGPQATRKEAGKQRREGTTQSVLASAGTPEGSGSWRIGRSGQGECRAQAAVEAQGAKSGEMKSEDQKSKGPDPREVSPGDSLSFLAVTRPGTAAMEGKPSEGDSRWRSRIAHCGEAAGARQGSEMGGRSDSTEDRADQTHQGGNAMNPMVGCRMQQACSARAEETVEVGWNDKDGTSLAVAAPGRRERGERRSRRRNRTREWTLEAYVDEGAVFGEPQERS